MQPPSPDEQQRILAALHPGTRALVPHVMGSLDLVKAACSQRQPDEALPAAVAEALAAAGAPPGSTSLGLGIGRHLSIRDALKLCCRLSTVHSSLLQRSLKGSLAADYQASVTAVPLTVRQAAFTEAADCFAALVSRPEAAEWLLAALAALWALPREAVHQYLALHKPAVQQSAVDLTFGRVSLPLVDSTAAAASTQRLLAATAAGGAAASRYTPTGHALRHMERIAVAVSQSEPVLLVGETGTGALTLLRLQGPSSVLCPRPLIWRAGI